GQYRLVNPTTIKINANVKDGSNIQDIRESNMPWEDGFPHSKEQLVMDGESITLDAMMMHGEMACQATHSK
ncbi:hypothetical protein KI387_033303, partial [Taxus chinensis]